MALKNDFQDNTAKFGGQAVTNADYMITTQNVENFYDGQYYVPEIYFNVYNLQAKKIK